MAFKAYTYTENEHLSEGVHDKVLLEREKLLAAEFVDSNPYTGNNTGCPFCASDDTPEFAVIGGAQYYRCKNCWSIFTPVSEELIDKYRQYAPLIKLREASEYQETGKKRRMAVWQEQLFWVQYRCARYLKQLKELSIMELGGRYEGFSEMFKTSCASFSSYKTICEAKDTHDAIIYFGHIMQETKPVETLKKISGHINRYGLLFLNTRVSTGFDILTLKGNINSLYPYDCASVPSIEALETVLDKAGFEILEISTPGALDMLYVTENSSKLERGDLFSRYLVEKADESVRTDFQRFLQKSMISSHAQLVARLKP